jgi:hypothetical protein
MISAPYQAAGRRSQSLAAMERDAALVRVTRVRRWLIAGAAALSAGFAALVSSVAPGHTLKSRSASSGPLTAARTVTPPKASTRMPPLASPSDLGLQGPSSAPQSAGGSSDSSSSQAGPDPSQSGGGASNPAAVAPAPQPAPQPAPAVVSGGS